MSKTYLTIGQIKHDGKRYGIGEKIELDDALAEKMKAGGVIEDMAEAVEPFKPVAPMAPAAPVVAPVVPVVPNKPAAPKKASAAKPAVKKGK
ncbi:MAG: hypothetical protein A2Z95_06205 [Gallionellales bacterium GWA2_60_18]|nr:MAG: hypothetical protein A2Z95_06205 [Gallionellales bacterium GWA2_60_18]